MLAGVVPWPDESLIGLVARTSAGNWIDRMQPLLDAAGSPPHTRRNLAVHDDLDVAQLAFAARLPVHAIESRRYRRILSIQDRGVVGYHGTPIPAYDVTLLSRRLAPSWLKAGYHSALGHHGLVTHCPRTGEILFDRCPRCDRRLAWTDSAIEFCGACGLDLAAHDGASVSERTLISTRLMIDLINPDPAYRSAAVASLHPDIAQLGGGDAFELGWRMGCAFTGHVRHRRANSDRLPFATRVEILEAGTAALADWPDSLDRALKDQATGLPTTFEARISNLRFLARAPTVSPEVKAVLRNSAPGLFSSTAKAVKSTLEAGANTRELQQMLGVGSKIVNSLRRTQHLAPVRRTGKSNSHEIFEGAGMAPLKVLLDDTVEVGTICHGMAISRHGVEQLACLGAITIFDDGPVSDAYQLRRARKSDYVRVLQELAEAATDLDEDRRLPIHFAMRSIGAREKPWGPAIAAMLAGDLPFFLDQGEAKVLARVSIDVGDLHKVKCLGFDRAQFPEFAFDQVVNGRDAEEMLNIKPKTTGIARREKTLPNPIDGGYPRGLILGLAERHISGSEVLARWISQGTKSPDMFWRRGGLERISALGWDRAVAENEMAAATARDRSSGRREEWIMDDAVHPDRHAADRR